MSLNNVITIPLTIDKTRALVQASASFGGPHVVLWEYVVNGLSYQTKGNTPTVEVKIQKDSIEIVDNGRGMDKDDLVNFFKGYAENKDRIEGNYVYIQRGYFGTGGFAIFKIADHLKITSVKNNKIYEGEIAKKDIANDKGFSLTRNGDKTEIPNGTKFIATGLKKEFTKKIISDAKEYIQKQMMNVKGAQVFINDDLLEYKEPPIENEFTKIVNSEDTEYYENLKKYGFGAGKIKLTLKKTKKPLPKGEYGVSVLGDGNLLEVCSPGIETKKYCNHIIGEAEIQNIYQNLEKFDPPIFDQSRRMELSKDNKYVVILRNFIAQQLINFESEVSNIEKEREKNKFDQELNNKLNKISGKANEILSDELEKLDLNSVNNHNLTNKSRRNANLKEAIGKLINPGDDFFKKNKKDKVEKKLKKEGNKPDNIIAKPNSKIEDDKTKNNNSGGLRILHKSLGDEELRADFFPEKSIIFVNTDFPPLKKYMLERNYENEKFNLFINEIIATELAVAITARLIQKEHYGSDMTTAMVELRERINEFSKKFDEF